MKSLFVFLSLVTAVPTAFAQASTIKIVGPEAEKAYAAMTSEGEVFLADQSANAKTGNSIQCVQKVDNSSTVCVIEVGPTGISQ